MGVFESLRSLRTLWRSLQVEEFPELFGPTNVNAQSSNQRLAVALDRDATVTVLRYPRPSFYDQLKYRARSRSKPYMGALDNEGAFLGLRVATETVWLRDCESRQRYADGRTDTVVTTYEVPEFGTTVTVRDVVARETDALVRDVEVAADPESNVDEAWLVSYANLALVTSKRPRAPAEDWAYDGDRTGPARYRPDVDAVVYRAAGVDGSTGRRRSVALGTAFREESDGHQVGGDAHEPRASTPTESDAFDDASDGPLSNVDSHDGHTTTALSTALDLSDGDASATAYLVAGETPDEVGTALETLRERDPAEVRAEKRSWYESLLADAPMPATDDEAVLALCRRALVTLVSNYDPESGAVVASIATQNPYSLDWPRDGAFFNHALHLLGLDDWVEQRVRWYASLQAGSGPDQPGQKDIPEGNWAMNYYADGVVGGPIPYEIDQTAYALWTLVDHYEMTDDEDYLRDVYPAISRAASFLCAHRDPDTGLHAAATEDDNVLHSQSVVGAAPIWMALGAAARAADALGESADADRFRARQAELGEAIETHLWEADAGSYTGGGRLVRVLDSLQSVPVLGEGIRMSPLVPNTAAQPAIYWPVGFDAGDAARMDRHLEHVFEHIAATVAEPQRGDRKSGMYETMGLVALARGWRDDADRMDSVRNGVEWVAREHATDDTYVMGEMWLRHEGQVLTTASQPHTWAQTLFYYAALEAFPPAAFETDESDSVVDWLRARQRDGDGAVPTPEATTEN